MEAALDGLGSSKPRGTDSLHDTKQQSECADVVEELQTFDDISTTTSEDSEQMHNMKSEQEIKEATRAIILLTDSYINKKERQQNEQSESVPSLTNITSSLQLLSKLIWNNNACKSVSKIPKLLQSLSALSRFKIDTHIDLDVDRQRIELRHWSREYLYWIQRFGDAKVQTDLVNVEYGKMTFISFCTAGGIGEEHNKEINDGLYHIECFLRELHEGRNEYFSSFQPLQLLVRITEEQIEEEGGNEELEAKIKNNGYYGFIKNYANDVKAATPNHSINLD
ncbi:MAG: hypothetical protein EZS28_017470 [Streblomastix strix]|uniref:Uncharacterized protein n=1 Tax=Streblomastix strix TaxID=222440 RepID=A0A5J4VWW8_9EUKA|nr:MAG: hypothetical protein EZS28_017470 [Streblomastix strix]